MGKYFGWLPDGLIRIYFSLDSRLANGCPYLPSLKQLGVPAARMPTEAFWPRARQD